MSAYKDKNGRHYETITQVAKSTPVLDMLILRNIVSSTPYCKVKELKKKCDKKQNKQSNFC